MSDAAWLWAWLRAFLVTQAVEAPLYRYGYGASWPVALGASALTHPLLWLAYYFGLVSMLPLDEGAQLVVVEGIVCLIEALFLARAAGREAALFWAMLANGASVLFGTVSRALVGWP